jgi:Na+-transporting NADH:ubiquinone oxidoreductase subunit NqrB
MAVATTAPPVLTVRGRSYPVLLPRLSDPRLHLATVIISLQILGQAALGFRVSIAQILVALGTCAVIEIGITLRRQQVLMWPASALITGNGVAFVLRVPGTEHGDWWSLHGWWIFAGTAAVGLLSKHVIRVGGKHIFNPSNLGLVLCFLLLGSDRAEPLDFWWGPLSPALVLALVIIAVGALVILSRLKLLGLAVAFWASFAAALGVLAASGHSMTASWHLGAITDASFWWVIVTSPELLVFLFFMLTDPKTIPAGARARITYAVVVGLLAALLIAPQTQEFGTKVALLGALALVCAAIPVVERLPRWSVRLRPAGVALAAACLCVALVVAGAPARTGTGAVALATTRVVDGHGGPAITIVAARDVATTIEPAQARSMVGDVVSGLAAQAAALRARDEEAAAKVADAAWLLRLERRIERAGRTGPIAVPRYDIARVRFTLARRPHQMMPAILVTLQGTERVTTYTPGHRAVRAAPAPYRHTFEIATRDGHYILVTDELPPGWHQ